MALVSRTSISRALNQRELAKILAAPVGPDGLTATDCNFKDSIQMYKSGPRVGRLYVRGVKRGGVSPAARWISTRALYHLTIMGNTPEAWAFRDYMATVAKTAKEMLLSMQSDRALRLETHGELTRAATDFQGACAQAGIPESILSYGQGPTGAAYKSTYRAMCGVSAKDACMIAGNVITPGQPMSSGTTRHGKRKAAYILSSLSHEVMDNADNIRSDRQARDAHDEAERAAGRVPKKLCFPALTRTINTAVASLQNDWGLLRTAGETSAQRLAREDRVRTESIRCFGQDQEQANDSRIAQLKAQILDGQPPLAMAHAHA